MTPNRTQWVVLWSAAIWTIFALVAIEEYVLRAVFGGWVVAGLTFWQLAGARTTDNQTRQPAEPFTMSPIPWVFMTLLFFCVAAFAAYEGEDGPQQALALVGGLFWFWILLSDTIRRVAKRAGVEQRWRAWVPLLQFLLLIDVAEVSQMWVVVLLTPLNFVAMVWIWRRALPRIGFSSNYAFVLWIPVVSAPFMAYIASRERVIPARPRVAPVALATA
jgi:hypothetical protein